MVTRIKTKKKGSSKSKHCITKSQLALISAMRKLWMEHAFWTKNAIDSILAGSDDTGVVVDRLLRNQDDIGNLIKPYYGIAAGNQLATLLRSHINIAGELVQAVKAGDQTNIERLNQMWYANADQIVAFLSKANPELSEAELKTMFYKHLQQVTDIVMARASGNWAKEVMVYDAGENHLIHIADYLAQGIIKQFPARFK